MKKKILVFIILLMSIGFAAVSTTLIIKGNANVNENKEDFEIYFSDAKLDNKNVYDEVISDDKKSITFTSEYLIHIGDTSILTYEVTNNSLNYDAEVRINCNEKTGLIEKHTSVNNILNTEDNIVKAMESVTGTLTITLDKTSTSEIIEEYVCTLEFSALERDTIGYNGPYEWMFSYTGGEQELVIPIDGTYKIETWGAQGGSVYGTGGYGAYSTGQLTLTKKSKLYINVGNQPDTYEVGGYNGGGAGAISDAAGVYHSSGGGATSVSTISGLITDISDEYLLIISGGGGGGDKYTTVSLAGTGGGGYSTTKVNCFTYKGSASIKERNEYTIKGQGENASGGGGGYIGGSTVWGTNMSCSATGGTGYIGNSLLTNKSMYCYNCSESSEESTKTVSTTCVSETPTSNCSKKGNGYARITLIK